jgi:hypothetical protein
MNDTTFDPNALIEAYRKTFAPTAKAQQERVKVIDRVGRYQYAVAGDYLDWTLAQAKAAVGAQTPADFVSRQMALVNALGEKLRTRVQEFVSLATDAQTSFSQGESEATAKVAEVTKKAA